MRKTQITMLSLLLSVCLLITAAPTLVFFPAAAINATDTETVTTANNIETAQDNCIDFYVYIGDTDLAFYCPKPSEEYPEFWYSDDESVATISSSGVVTPLSEGTTLITAEVQDSDGWLYNVWQITLHVLEPEAGDVGNGVFDIYGPSTMQILSSYETDEALTSLDGVIGDSNANPRAVQYKINYVGDGAYTIRSMLNNSLAWTYSGGSLVLTDIGILNEVPNNAKWNIIQSGSGFKISPLSSPYLYVTCPTSFNSTITFSSSSSSNQIWSFSESTLTGSGVDITSNIMYAYAGDTVNMEAAIYSYNPYFNGGYNFYWSVDDTSVATINQTTGQLTGVSEGVVDVTVNVGNSYSDAFWSAIYSLIIAFVPENGTYYIQNAGTERYINVEGSSTSSGAYIQQWDYQTGNQEKWIIERIPNSGGYVRIKSAHSNLYLGVDSSNTSLIKQYGVQNNYTLWRFESNLKGNYILYCKATENLGYALAIPSSSNSNGTNLTQEEVLLDNEMLNSEWFLVKKVISSVNYYDSSFTNDSILKNYIVSANSFANLVYARYYNVSMYMDGAATQHTSIIIDNCSTGTNSHCNSTTCGPCSSLTHHKNIFNISNQLYNESREDNHIYILWTNREEGTYCKGTSERYTPLAVVCYNRPIIHFLKISTPKNVCMSLVLVHEIAHSLHMEEVYDTPIHNGSGYCIMNKYDKVAALSFYAKICNNTSKPFCDSCDQAMKNHTSNINIQGN